jgi:predicted nucleic acid-binding Zn ribbon protein
VTGRRRRRWARDVPGEEAEPTRLADALAEVGAGLGLADPGVIGVLNDRWPEIVGPAVAPNARLRSLRGSTLTIAVETGAWATQLRYLEAQLKARIAAIVGDGVIDDVRVVVAPRELRD